MKQRSLGYGLLLLYLQYNAARHNVTTDKSLYSLSLSCELKTYLTIQTGLIEYKTISKRFY